MNKLIIREMRPAEYFFLQEMLYQAIYVHKGEDQFPREIIHLPEIWHYISGFGREHDYCFVAEFDGELVGAIWSRLFSADEKGYGYVDESTPEVSMAVDYAYRNRGIGGQLLKTMLAKMKSLNYKAVSLSVDIENYAYQLYLKNGFEDVHRVDKSMTMIKKLDND
jgi:GNAT superfamily N-acetyltransferase